MAAGIEVRDEAGASIEALVDVISSHPDNSIEQATVTFIATDVPRSATGSTGCCPTTDPGPVGRHVRATLPRAIATSWKPTRAGGSLVRLYDKGADRGCSRR